MKTAMSSVSLSAIVGYLIAVLDVLAAQKVKSCCPMHKQLAFTAIDAARYFTVSFVIIWITYIIIMNNLWFNCYTITQRNNTYTTLDVNNCGISRQLYPISDMLDDVLSSLNFGNTTSTDTEQLIMAEEENNTTVSLESTFQMVYELTTALASFPKFVQNLFPNCSVHKPLRTSLLYSGSKADELLPYSGYYPAAEQMIVERFS